MREVSATGGSGYVVQAGDNLSTIAGRTLGDPNRYPEIAAASGVADPNLIQPGKRLTIPGTLPLPQPSDTAAVSTPTRAADVKDAAPWDTSGTPPAPATDLYQGTPPAGVASASQRTSQFQLGLSDADAYA